MATKEDLIGFAGGVLLGYVINEVWERLGGPGYGVGIIPLARGVKLGADDMAEMGIGGCIAVAGKVKRNSPLVWAGAGEIVGVAVTKIKEIVQAG